MTVPLLELTDLGRDYPTAGQAVQALKNINLSIEAGDMVAIIGASGSGKSTLMNILGCLDRPTHGRYRVMGRDIATLDADALARLRREHFGFIFQRYHLLPHLSALGNVEIPAIYAGTPRQERLQRAERLLTRLGLDDRLDHRPEQLSGGQQQRVSIARALVNGGKVILADEPTGALDRQSGAEMMRLLEDLHDLGHTIIIVTHSPEIARHAERIIEISDGEVVSDKITRQGTPAPTPVGAGLSAETSVAARASPPAMQALPAQSGTTPGFRGPPRNFPAVAENAGGDAPATKNSLERDPPPDAPMEPGWRTEWDCTIEALRMALLAMAAHRLRSFLTMLGIIIGIASVVSVVALGEGSRQRVLEDISAIGTNTIQIFPGKDFGDERAGAIRTLMPADADMLGQQSYLDSVTPSVSTMASLRHGNVSLNGSINGVGEQFFRVRGYSLAEGRLFSRGSVERRSQDVVIDATTRKKLFGKGKNAVGEVIFLGDVPCRVIGVTAARATAFGNSENLNVWIPYTTAMNRVLGQNYLQSITVRVGDSVTPKVAEGAVIDLLHRRHRTTDFFVMNTDTIHQTIEKTATTMALLISLIAVISLIVGGIGVMNIMLVSVTERTREIGVRIAVGARQSDILRQFLIEAVLVCLLGGTLGVGLALSGGLVVKLTGSTVRMIYSTASIVAAFGCSTLIGVIFGFLPARNAARLDPVEALARE